MIFVMDKRDIVLRYESGAIRLEKENKLIQRIPIKQLEQVIVYGNPLAETAVWRALATADVPTVMLSQRGALQTAMIGSGLAVQLPIRRAQHQLANEEKQSLKLAKWFIQNKINSYDIALECLVRNYPSSEPHQTKFKQQQKSAINTLTQANDIQSIMGIEGQMAHHWFSLLSQNMERKWQFNGRNRRPPKDPINALLSLGYTLLMSEVRQTIISFGLDPSLGFLHQDYPGRESLVLDVTEIFRSAVDCFVLQAIACNKFDTDDFYYRSQQGCRLSKQARPVFFQAWAGYREEWPRPIAEMTEQSTRIAPIREQIMGQLINLREFMKIVEKNND